MNSSQETPWKNGQTKARMNKRSDKAAMAVKRIFTCGGSRAIKPEP